MGEQGEDLGVTDDEVLRAARLCQPPPLAGGAGVRPERAKDSLGSGKGEAE